MSIYNNQNKKFKIAELSKSMREKKDLLKRQIRPTNLRNKQAIRIIIPKLLIQPTIDILRDKWYFNGFILAVKSTYILVDPGVDFYTRFLYSGLNFTSICGIIISHSHLDHIYSLNLFLDKFLRNKVGSLELFLPSGAYKDLIFKEIKEKISCSDLVHVHQITPNFSYNLKSGSTIEFIKLYHSIKGTYGFKLTSEKVILGFISDTGYSIRVKTNKGTFSPETSHGQFESIIKKHQYIKNFFKEAGTVVVNINDIEYNRHSKYHLSGWDVLDLFKKTNIKNIILQHISPYNAVGRNNLISYKKFFYDEAYKVIIPGIGGRVVTVSK